MRKLLLLSILLFLFVSGPAQFTERIYHFDNPSITETDGYNLIHFNNTILSGIPGEPTLPYHKVFIQLKPGQVADSIELIFEDEVILKRMYNLYPAQYPIQYSNIEKINFIKDSNLYNKDHNYPLQPSGKLITAYHNGLPIVLSTFTPVRFNPVRGELSYYRKVKAGIYITTNNPQPATRNNPKSNSYQILTITSQNFQNRFQPLMDLYLTHGLKSQVITTNNISQVMPGQDLQEKIRNYIIQEYQNHNIEYVLLGGDDEIIPHRGFYTAVQSTSLYENYDIPSDIYYSALDGNWNTDNDSLWGEPGEEDLLPEVAVGRLVISDTNDLNTTLNKIISYQSNPVQGELRDPLLVGEHLYSNPLTWGGDYLDLLIGFQTANGYTTDGIPYGHNIQKLYDRDVGTWAKDTLINRINQGKSFVHHTGHANSYYAMRMNLSDINNSNFNPLDGITHNFTLVYSHGCYSGAFDASDCIAEKMLNIERFALAYVGNSRYGWFNEGQTEGPSTHMHREFTSALYSNRINRLGKTHMVSKTNTAPWVTLPGQFEDGALRHCMYGCNVLGDPVLAVWTDEIVQINATYQDTLQVLDPFLAVMIDTNGSPVQGYTCTVIKNGNFHGSALTDNLGYAYVNLDPPVLDTGKAVIIVTGYNCLSTEFPVYFNTYCPAPIIDLGPDTIINPGVTITLEADTGFVAYLWSDGSTNRTLNVDTTGIYWVEGTTLIGCLSRDTVLVCSGYIISGILEYKDTLLVSTPLEGVNIILKDQNNIVVGSTVTDTSGFYEFRNLYSGNYYLEEQISIDWGGVSTLDALKVVFQFIGLVPLSGLNLDAGDVTADGVVTSVDALNIQLRFVGLISSFPAGNWICESDTIVVGGNTHCTHNYHALCFGDVDGSYTPVNSGGNATIYNSSKSSGNKTKITSKENIYHNNRGGGSK